jgi:glycosyltransferase involved in cell wall biosynthesis
MTETLKVTIVLPTYNGSSYILQSIKSCLEQTYQNIELIIIDDGSTDDTAVKVRSINDQRMKYIRLEKNQGHIAALNTGFRLSQGNLLTWTSDDNYYDPKAIEIMAGELLGNPFIDFVYANYQVIDNKDTLIKMGRVESPGMLDVDNYVGGCFLYRRKVYETIGDFNPQAFLAEDYEYWLKVRTKFRMKKINPCLYFYRQHSKSLTGVHKEQKVQEQVEKIRDQYIKEWKRCFFHGKKCFDQNNSEKAKAWLLKSFTKNPFYLPTLRLLALLYLDKQFVNQMRNIKHSLLKKS